MTDVWVKLGIVVVTLGIFCFFVYRVGHQFKLVFKNSVEAHFAPKPSISKLIIRWNSQEKWENALHAWHSMWYMT